MPVKFKHSHISGSRTSEAWAGVGLVGVDWGVAGAEWRSR